MNPDYFEEKMQAKLRDLSSALPYPKLMRDTRNPKNIIFALDDETIVIMVHPSHEVGKLMNRVKVSKFFDYDGVIYPNWMNIIHEYCNPREVEHFNMYLSEAQRHSVRSKEHRSSATKEAITKGRVKFEEEFLGKFIPYDTKGHTWGS